MSAYTSRLASSDDWVDAASLPKYRDVSQIAGNASDNIKQITYNVLGSYGAGDPSCFAHHVGQAIQLTEINIYKRGDKLQAEAIAEVVVSESQPSHTSMYL